jgi:hypothetical protein
MIQELPPTPIRRHTVNAAVSHDLMKGTRSEMIGVMWYYVAEKINKVFSIKRI